MKTTTTTRDRVLGTLWGISLGDAFGMPMEMWPRDRRERQLGYVTTLLPGQPDNDISKGRAAGETTDDSAFSRLICELLIEYGAVEPLALAQRIIAWRSRGGEKCELVLGPSTKQAIESIAAGGSVEEAGRGGRTNGAAMRILPVGIAFDWRNEAHFAAQVNSACKATHNTNVAMGAAGAVAAAVSCAVRGGTSAQTVDAAVHMAEVCQRQGFTVSDVSVAERIRRAADIAAACRSDEDVMRRLSDEIGTGLPAEDSIPTAIALGAHTGGDPMRCAVLCANIGGDTDTMGAIACGICGALSGMDAMDAAVLAQIRQASGIDWTPYADGLLRIMEQEKDGGTAL